MGPISTVTSPMGRNTAYAINVRALAERESKSEGEEVGAEAGMLEAGMNRSGLGCLDLLDSRSQSVVPACILRAAGRFRRRLSYREFGLDRNFRVPGCSFNSLQQALRGDFSHAIQGLPHRGKAWSVKLRAGNVVEPHDGDILGNAQAVLLKSPDGADGGDIVVGEQSGEGFVAREQLLGEGISQHRR